MKKTLLSILVALCAAVSVSAQEFEWGTATWNIADGKTYTDIDELDAEGVILTYPNPAGYTLTYFNIVIVDYNVFVDDSTSPIATSSSAQMSAAVKLDYDFVEGHSYKIVTTGAKLAMANLATRSTDTISVNTDSYTISFSIDGPELVKSYDVEGTMSLTITDQEGNLTYSAIDVNEICSLLGIGSINDARVYGLNVNGSYNPYYISDYDGWRDADGEYTTYWSGWNQHLGHNAYPAVYCIKLDEACDTVRYYFYDYWKEYDPTQPDTIGGSSIGSANQRRSYSPTTSYHKMIWDWDNGDGTITQYTRSYRVDEGKDYKASFIIIANKKAVKINATLHFISQDAYAANVSQVSAPITSATEIYSLNGTRQSSLHKGINIVRENGKVKKILK